MRAVLAVVLLSGCAQMLGLENTKFDQRDATVDAPSVCDGAPACIVSSGRSTCGQLMQTGADAGTPLRVASPTGQSCAMLNSSEGPCALTIFGQPMASYFAQDAASRIAGEIDDCGRFVVPDIDHNAANVAVVVTGTDIAESAAVVIGRETVIGTDVGVVLPVVTLAASTAWGMQLVPSNPPDVTSSYLVTFATMSDMPYQLRVGGAAVGDPPTQPWGAYFSGTVPFGTLDPVLDGSQANRSALVVPPSGLVRLSGQRPGKTCVEVMVQAVPGALIHVTLSC